MKHFLSALLAIGLVASCATMPKDIPQDLTPSEIIQKAQEATDVNNYDAAVVYYSTAKERFSDQMGVVVACEYEIAFIAYKRGRYEEAEAGLKAVRARYEAEDAALLPAQYKILSETVLGSIQKKTTK